MGRRKTILLSLIALFIASGVYFKRYYSEEQTLNRIIKEQGYHLYVQDKGISFEFSVEEEWIPEHESENVVNLLVKEQYQTKIILRKVIVSDSSITFDFEARTSTAANRRTGEFLYLDEIVNSGSFKSYDSIEKWKFTDINGVDLIYDNHVIDGYGSGQGPGNQFSVSLDQKYRNQIKEGLIVKFSGFILYKYSKSSSSWPLLFSVV